MEWTEPKAKTEKMELHIKGDNGPLEEVIARLIAVAAGIKRPAIVREMILTSLKAGQEDNLGVDLKLMNTSLKEMRYTAKVFGAYEGVKKVSVFGSARTPPTAETYRTAFSLGRELAGRGYMVITGGGAGIMQAVNEGAGAEHSFGINIRLPFEQEANPIVQGGPRSIDYKYFFNRKVAFIKESDAVVLFPGGFGTFDEGMEILTLVQTGKRNPVPILLAEEPGGTYWLRWVRFVEETILPHGYIGEADLKLFERVEAVEEAVDRIDRFYRRYHSLRWVRDLLVIRLRSAPDGKAFERLRQRYMDILTPGGKMILSDALPLESDEAAISHLPRVVLSFNRRDFGKLKQFIDDLNRL